MSQLIQLPQACNSVQSQKFGRRVYQIQQGDQIHWLKLQLQNSNSAYSHSFLNELKIYKQLNQIEKSDQNILCNFAIFNPYQKFNIQEDIQEDIIDQALWIEDVAMLFDQDSECLELSEIHHRLILSLDVLGHLHDLGFVHGDLKKEHFRLQKGKTCLIDFEQAFDVDALSNRQDAQLNTATPRYMAPELFHAEQKSFQSDLYALGIIWLEWLTGQRLMAKSYQDWAVLHCQQLKVALPERFKPLEEVLESMLKKKIEQRCSNIYQIKQQLSQIV